MFKWVNSHKSRWDLVRKNKDGTALYAEVWQDEEHQFRWQSTYFEEPEDFLTLETIDQCKEYISGFVLDIIKKDAQYYNNVLKDAEKSLKVSENEK